MKRTIAVLLSVLLLCTCVACNQNTNLKSLQLDKAIIETGKTYTNFEGVNIQIANAVWTDEEIKIDINWNNQTSYEVVYGESFDIKKEINGKWESCVTLDNLAFDSIGYELKAHTTQKKTYNLTDTFDIYENGKYRFISYCHIYNKGRGGESTKCEMWVEFTVKRTSDTSKDIKKSFIDFNTQYIRTDGYYEDVKYPIVKVIRSVDQLNEYLNANEDKITAQFIDACKKYDETYFKKQILVMVLLEENSGSNRHNVDNVKLASDGKLYISIRTIIPEVGTCDMAQWHILIEPEENLSVISESDVVVYLDGVNPKTQPTTVYQSGTFSNISLTIPHDWNYETQRGNDESEYYIAFWPEEKTEGKIKLWYYNLCGVCGTGLEVKDITIGEYKATQGTYDNNKVWDFITFSGTPGRYMVINDGAEKWWDEYGDKAMQILSTVKIAEGIINEEQAIEIAKKKVSVEYDHASAKFDTQKGMWEITFSNTDNADESQVFTLTHEGKIIDTQQWVEKTQENKWNHDHDPFSDITITQIYSDCFFATAVIPSPYEIKLNGKLSDDWCVGDQVICSYENVYYDEKSRRIEADLINIKQSTFQLDPFVAYKPVIYLYPEEKTDVSVKLDLDGKLTCTYPEYKDGWEVTASPDGTLTDKDGKIYSYLYWEGDIYANYDLSQGFCIKGEDTADFLEYALEKLGLTRREANEFIVYWLPLMQNNPYNVISFQTNAYTDVAKLSVNPSPDTLIRIFMTWQASESYIKLSEQQLLTPTRDGFVVVEWGGTEIRR